MMQPTTSHYTPTVTKYNFWAYPDGAGLGDAQFFSVSGEPITFNGIKFQDCLKIQKLINMKIAEAIQAERWRINGQIQTILATT